MRFSGLTLIVALLASTIASALPQKPQGSYVYDEDRLMNSRQIDFFDRLSKELLDKTGICVAAVIVDDIEHADARTYASRIATEWNESSNGTILIFAVIKQRTSADAPEDLAVIGEFIQFLMLDDEMPGPTDIKTGIPVSRPHGKLTQIFHSLLLSN